jgi:hypothetical protein
MLIFYILFNISFAQFYNEHNIHVHVKQKKTHTRYKTTVIMLTRLKDTVVFLLKDHPSSAMTK